MGSIPTSNFISWKSIEWWLNKIVQVMWLSENFNLKMTSHHKITK